VPEQKEGDGVGVRRDVERLVAAHADERASRHVADGITAGFARRDADRREPAHEIGRIVDVNEVELNILARRDVEDRIRILFSELRHHFQLLGAELAERDLDPLHAGRVPQGARPFGELGSRKRERPLFDAVVPLAVVVALAVHAPAKACFGKELLLDPPLLSEVDLSLENVDLFSPGGRYLPPERLLPGRLVHSGLRANW
jgi:hypothetical protein